MASITLNAEQKKAIEKAKASGKRRIVMELTDSQRAAMKKAEAEIDSEKQSITEKARRALAEQKACEATLFQAACLLAAAREQRGLSITELAKRTGITRQALSLIERGENKNPTFSTLSRIADALGKEVVVQLRDAV